LIVLGALPNGQDLVRCGFVVSRKLGKAVERNQIRRRLREAVRHCYPQIQPGWDLVWIARPPIYYSTFSQIGDAVEELLQQAGVWRDPE